MTTSAPTTTTTHPTTSAPVSTPTPAPTNAPTPPTTSAPAPTPTRAPKYDPTPAPTTAPTTAPNEGDCSDSDDLAYKNKKKRNCKWLRKKGKQKKKKLCHKKKWLNKYLSDWCPQACGKCSE